MFDSLFPVLDLNLVLAMVIGLGGGIVHGFTGFGGGLFMMPLITILFGPIEAIAVVHISAIPGILRLLPQAIRETRREESLPMAAIAVIATPLGGLTLFLADPNLVRIGMGVFVIFSALILTTGWSYRGPRNYVTSGATGAVSGFINGFAGVGGPPMAIYFLAAPDSAIVQRANILIVSTVVVTMTIVGVWLGGGISTGSIWRAIVMAPTYMFGVVAGAYLFRVAPSAFYRPAALVLLFASGGAVFIF